jgi:WXG100 family type VII secretion target
LGQPFVVDAATLNKAAGDVKSTRGDVDGDLKKLLDVVDDLAIAWQGRASTGFQQLMSRWNTDTNQLLTALDNIADLLTKSAAVHQANEEQQQSMFNNKFGSALNPQ